jgi:hypothetical protein
MRASDFWSVAKDLLPKIAESNPTPPGKICCGSHVMSLADATALKRVKRHPSIGVLPDKFIFELNDIKDARS